MPVSREYVVESWKPALQYNEPPKAFWFLVEEPEGKPVGLCGIQSINYIHGDAVIPLFVAQDYRRKGLALSMLIELMELAFDQLRLHRLSTIYRANNQATENLVTSVGFAKEGRIREGWYADGQHHDIIQVGLLNSEWLDTKQVVKKRLAETSFELVKRSKLQN